MVKNMITLHEVYENLKNLIGEELNADDIICAFEDFQENGESEVIVSESNNNGYDYSAYINDADSSIFTFAVDTSGIITNVDCQPGAYYPTYTVVTHKGDSECIKWQGNDIEEAKQEARDEEYYIKRDNRKGERVELVHTWDYEESDYNTLDFAEVKKTTGDLNDLTEVDRTYLVDTAYYMAEDVKDNYRESIEHMEWLEEYSEEAISQILGQAWEKGQEQKFDDICKYMDDEKREKIHNQLAPCGRMDFIEAYVDIDPEFIAVLKDFNIEL